MRKRIEWVWELLNSVDEGRAVTARAKVIGGWIVKSCTQDLKQKLLSESMVFIADREHEWSILPPSREETQVIQGKLNPNDFASPKAE